MNTSLVGLVCVCVCVCVCVFVCVSLCVLIVDGSSAIHPMFVFVCWLSVRAVDSV